MGTAEGSPSYAERAKMDRLGRLYETHAPAATRLAYLLMGDRQLARDLAQDAFIRVAGRFAAIRARSVDARANPPGAGSLRSLGPTSHFLTILPSQG